MSCLPLVLAALPVPSFTANMLLANAFKEFLLFMSVLPFISALLVTA
jgi:hypothetical protein